MQVIGGSLVKKLSMCFLNLYGAYFLISLLAFSSLMPNVSKDIVVVLSSAVSAALVWLDYSRARLTDLILFGGADTHPEKDGHGH